MGYRAGFKVALPAAEDAFSDWNRLHKTRLGVFRVLQYVFLEKAEGDVDSALCVLSKMQRTSSLHHQTTFHESMFNIVVKFTRYHFFLARWGEHFMYVWSFCVVRDKILEQLAAVVQNVFSSFSLPIFVKTPLQPFTCIKYTGTASLSGKYQVIQRKNPFCNRIISWSRYALLLEVDF